MMNDKTHEYNTSEEIVELDDIIRTLLTHKWLIFACVVIAVAIGAFQAKFRVPVYEANSLIDVNSSSSNSLISTLLQGSGASGGGGGYFGMRSLETEKNILTSRSVLEPTVQKLHLDVVVKSHYFPLIGHRMALNYDTSNYSQTIAPPRYGLDGYDWGGSHLSVQRFEVSPYFKGHEFVIQYLGNQQFLLKTPSGTVLAHGTTGQTIHLAPKPYATITLNINSIQASPNATFFITQVPMNQALDTLKNAINVKQENQFSNLLQVTLRGTDPVKTAAILNTLNEQAVFYSIQQTSQQAAQVLAFLHSRLPEAEKALNTAQSKLNRYRSQSGNIEIKTQTTAMLQQLGQIQSALSQAQLQKMQLQKQYTANSYPIQQIDGVIATYQQQEQLLTQKLRNLPAADQTLVTLMRDTTIQNAIYTSLLRNIQQYELIKAATVGTITVVDNADVPYQPVGTPGSMIVLIAAVLGLIIGCSVAFIRTYLSKGVQDTDVLEYQMGIPVLSMLHESPEQKIQYRKLKKHILPSLRLMSEIDPQNVLVESLRSLRTAILFKLPRPTGNIITVSGPSPEVGKSFVSANLAQILADAGRRVLLIDADIRRGDLYHYFKVAYKPGFTDLISGKVSAETVIHHSRIPNLDFLPSGTSSSHHAELLLRPDCAETLKVLAESYDIVLIDTAPVLALTDATILGAHADLRLLVIGYGRHHHKELQQTLNQFEKVGQKVDGCIFNRVPFKSKDYYGKYYYYRYNYRSKKNRNERAE